jgi:hypothetical protein
MDVTPASLISVRACTSSLMLVQERRPLQIAGYTMHRPSVSLLLSTD